MNYSLFLHGGQRVPPICYVISFVWDERFNIISTTHPCWSIDAEHMNYGGPPLNTMTSSYPLFQPSSIISLSYWWHWSCLCCCCLCCDRSWLLILSGKGVRRRPAKLDSNILFFVILLFCGWVSGCDVWGRRVGEMPPVFGSSDGEGGDALMTLSSSL